MTTLHNTLTGNLALGIDTATPIYVDVSLYCTSFVIGVSLDQVEVPQTMNSDKTVRPGAKTYSITLNYLNDPGTNSLFDILYTAASTGDGFLWFSANSFDGATSVTNPLWVGQFVVSGAQTGGDIGSIGSTSATFTLVQAPSKTTS